MSADHSKPALNSTKVSFPTEIRDNVDVVASMYDGDATALNKPTNSKRLDISDGQVYNWNGSSWDSVGYISLVRDPVSDAISSIVDGAPAALDTLNEIAAAIADDANYATTITTALGTKMVKTANGSDISNTATFRTNLDVYSKSEVDDLTDNIDRNFTELTSGTSYSVPAGATKLLVICIGGGGGGGGGRRSNGDADGGQGGGSGGVTVSWVTGFGGTIAYTLGSGGTGGAGASSDPSDGAAGADGGVTTFAGATTAKGGKGGIGNANDEIARLTEQFCVDGGAGGAGTGSGGSNGEVSDLSHTTISAARGNAGVSTSNTGGGGGGAPCAISIEIDTTSLGAGGAGGAGNGTGSGDDGGDATGYGGGGGGGGGGGTPGGGDGGDGSDGIIFVLVVD